MTVIGVKMRVCSHPQVLQLALVHCRRPAQVISTLASSVILCHVFLVRFMM